MMKATRFKAVLSLIFCHLLLGNGDCPAQGSMPEILDTGTVKMQLDYIHERTRIYNDYRAIREDMFQKIRSNAVDSIAAAKRTIRDLNLRLRENRQETDSMFAVLATWEDELDEAIKNKNNLPLLGLNMSKVVYNLIMWAVVIGLGVLVVILFLSFRRSHTVTVQTRQELETTREEFEEHRKKAREKYEKLVVSHHNEIRKLKEGR